jgi:hypothetical protein
MKIGTCVCIYVCIYECNLHIYVVRMYCMYEHTIYVVCMHKYNLHVCIMYVHTYIHMQPMCVCTSVCVTYVCLRKILLMHLSTISLHSSPDITTRRFGF